MKYLAVILVVISLIQMYIQFGVIAGLAERVKNLEIERDEAEHNLLDCLNGVAKWITEGEKEVVVCEPAWTTKLKD
jgi:oligoribonuclease (3'-5' exoribonuclease)